ncbi:MAG: hypothetical protein HYS67_02735, partial [Deltaproteobacteria bacterium]|nr:hypothetical protein [Deltaproteobacteria bacterium]
MPVDNPEKIGQELAHLALRLANGNEIESFIPWKGIAPIESRRFRFGLAIVNVAAAIYFVNMYVRNRDKAKAIINPLLDSWTDSWTDQHAARIGDFILLEEELDFLRIEVSRLLEESTHIGDIKNIGTDMSTLAGAMYNWRCLQYHDDLDAAMKNWLSGAATFSLNHVARRFLAQFTGKTATFDDLSLVAHLSVIFTAFFVDLMKYCQQRFALSPSSREVDNAEVLKIFRELEPEGVEPAQSTQQEHVASSKLPPKCELFVKKVERSTVEELAKSGFTQAQIEAYNAINDLGERLVGNIFEFWDQTIPSTFGWTKEAGAAPKLRMLGVREMFGEEAVRKMVNEYIRVEWGDTNDLPVQLVDAARRI